ncbi:glycosyltransferase family A protein [Cronobacter dublinensis]|uniref:glycosyltransferase family A protein n=1 Tax=Cronobacter dublinensis TaxID=413497 RepID=UPI000CFB113C|nr:glycosyltransferase family A protein [Cronobacter dublinensis]
MRFITKVTLAIQSIILSGKYLYLSLSSKASCNQSNGYIVTLTSFASRLNFVFLTIETILQQRYKPEKVILWLYTNDRPKGLARIILNKQSKRGLVIRYVERDVRSYKKLSYMLEHYPQANFFITADDDVIYPDDWLQGFKTAADRMPDKVYCYRGRIIDFDNNYTSWKLATDNRYSHDLLMPTGVSGVCYPREALDTRVADFDNIEKICPYADDIWYKLLTKARGYNAELVMPESVHHVPSLSGFKKGLEKINVLDDLNTQQFKDTLVYFQLSRVDFEK